MGDDTTPEQEWDQPPGFSIYDTDQPHPLEAANRILDFVAAWGDGCVDDAGPHKLFTRDLQSVAVAYLAAAHPDDPRRERFDRILALVRPPAGQGSA